MDSVLKSENIAKTCTQKMNKILVYIPNDFLECFDRFPIGRFQTDTESRFFSVFLPRFSEGINKIAARYHFVFALLLILPSQ